MASQHSLASDPTIAASRSGGHLFTLFSRVTGRGDSPGVACRPRDGQIALVTSIGALASHRGARVPRTTRGGPRMNTPPQTPGNPLSNEEWEAFVRQFAA